MNNKYSSPEAMLGQSRYIAAAHKEWKSEVQKLRDGKPLDRCVIYLRAQYHALHVEHERGIV